jgi:hypothetical protein
MPNNAMPYENSQKPAIPNQKQTQSADAEPVKRQPNDHPNQLDKGAGTKEAFENEGEGSRSAARNYDAATEKYVQSGRVKEAAENAEKALEGKEGESLRAAEAQARGTKPEVAKSEGDGGPSGQEKKRDRDSD